MTADRKGAALAEVLVALVILSIGAAGVMGMLTVASRGMEHAEVSFRAALAAAEAASHPPGTTGARELGAGVLCWSHVSSGAVHVLFESGVGSDASRSWTVPPEAGGAPPSSSSCWP